jgi:hypothetical protein
MREKGDPIYGEHEDIPRGPSALSGYLHVRHKLDLVGCRRSHFVLDTCGIVLPWVASSMAEQGTLNAKVQGSTPWRPITKSPLYHSKMSNGKNAEISQLGASTTSLTRRSTATLHRA